MSLGRTPEEAIENLESRPTLIDALIERLRAGDTGTYENDTMKQAADALAELRDKNTLNCQSAVNYGNKLSDAQAEIARLKLDMAAKERAIDTLNEGTERLKQEIVRLEGLLAEEHAKNDDEMKT